MPLFKDPRLTRGDLVRLLLLYRRMLFTSLHMLISLFLSPLRRCCSRLPFFPDVRLNGVAARIRQRNRLFFTGRS